MKHPSIIYNTKLRDGNSVDISFDPHVDSKDHPHIFIGTSPQSSMCELYGTCPSCKFYSDNLPPGTRSQCSSYVFEQLDIDKLRYDYPEYFI